MLSAVLIHTTTGKSQGGTCQTNSSHKIRCSHTCGRRRCQHNSKASVEQLAFRERLRNNCDTLGGPASDPKRAGHQDSRALNVRETCIGSKRSPSTAHHSVPSVAPWSATSSTDACAVLKALKAVFVAQNAVLTLHHSCRHPCRLGWRI